MVEEQEDSQFSSFDGSQQIRKYREPKSYTARLKRHQDAILSLYAPTGHDGPLLISGSADEKIRIWDFQNKTISPIISVERPSEQVLIRYQAIGEDNLPHFPIKDPLAGLPQKKA